MEKIFHTVENDENREPSFLLVIGVEDGREVV